MVGRARAKAPGRWCQEILKDHGWMSKASRGRSGQSDVLKSLADFCKTLPFPWIEMRATGGLVQEDT